jgi:hypothetical protein
MRNVPLRGHFTTLSAKAREWRSTARARFNLVLENTTETVKGELWGFEEFYGYLA